MAVSGHLHDHFASQWPKLITITIYEVFANKATRINIKLEISLCHGNGSIATHISKRLQCLSLPAGIFKQLHIIFIVKINGSFIKYFNLLLNISFKYEYSATQKMDIGKQCRRHRTYLHDPKVYNTKRRKLKYNQTLLKIDLSH